MCLLLLRGLHPQQPLQQFRTALLLVQPLGWQALPGLLQA